MKNFLNPNIEKYALDWSEPEAEVLRNLSRETRAKMYLPQMLSGHLQGLVLKMISRMVQPTRILEVGTFTGYSALCLASGLRKGGVLHTIDINSSLEKIIRKYINRAGFSRKIRLHFGNALQIIPEINGSFDLVFIDADKTNYSRYYDILLPRLKKDGILIADNLFWSGAVLKPVAKQDEDTRALRAFAQKVHCDKRVESMILPVRDGLLVCRKK